MSAEADTSRQLDLAARSDTYGRLDLAPRADTSGWLDLDSVANTSDDLTWPPKQICLDGSNSPQSDTSG